MALLSWREQYAIGVMSIDAEHRYLFRLINEFHDRHTSGAERRDVLIVLNRLVAYAEDHFHNEERLMSGHAYPHLERHREKHEQLFLSIFTLNEKLAAGVQSIDRETVQFLKSWLVGHILKDDMDFGEFMSRKARAALRNTPAKSEPSGKNAAPIGTESTEKPDARPSRSDPEAEADAPKGNTGDSDEA